VLSFGIKTAPMHVSYDDILRVWREADGVPQIEHAWLWDHLLPLAGPVDGLAYEGWTLLAALAAQTDRLELGLMVTSNRNRPPAVLAKIAATVDTVANGRLVMGLGVGGTHQPGPNPAVAEYAAYGLTLVPPAEGIARLAETCTILRRLWTAEVVDFDGPYTTLRGSRCEPKPRRRTPLLIGGWGDRTLRLVAEHADLWNMPGPPHNPVELIAERDRVLRAHCTAIGRDPDEIVRSVQTHVSYDDPAGTIATVARLVGIGVSHIVLNLPQPYPEDVVSWVADRIIAPCLRRG
jgi:alkanesulfonate monooxygenase SsuD/methylene tetrahydromethanopterin reductase-like flavin-dependent oxidoreductase (luciferase family)